MENNLIATDEKPAQEGEGHLGESGIDDGDTEE